MRKTCERCGAENSAVAEYCRQCGRPWGSPWVRPVVPTSPLLPAWRRLKLRMTRKEVRILLGEPARVDASPPDSPECERWTYEYERGDAVKEATTECDRSGRLQGAVCFHLADGGVTGWTEPGW